MATKPENVNPFAKYVEQSGETAQENPFAKFVTPSLDVEKLKAETKKYEEQVPFTQRITDPLKQGIANLSGLLPGLEVSSIQKEINAIREMNSQQPLTNDEALKVASAVKERFDYIAKDPTYLAEKVRDANLKAFKQALERIKTSHYKGAIKYNAGILAYGGMPPQKGYPVRLTVPGMIYGESDKIYDMTKPMDIQRYITDLVRASWATSAVTNPAFSANPTAAMP
jgi:hypothetical protein